MIYIKIHTVAFLVLFAAAHAHAADQALLDKAGGEGRATFYANITAVEPIIKAFTADTGVKGEYTRITSPKFVVTTITEFEAGKLMADVEGWSLTMLAACPLHAYPGTYMTRVASARRSCGRGFVACPCA